MYLGYTSASSYTAAVAASTPYYYASTTPLLGNVSIVPYTNYYGTFTIPYTGYSTSGESYTGTVSVVVADVAEPTTAITYTTDEDEAVTFTKASFGTACTNAAGGTLSYVKFTLPSSTYGKLYYGYTSSSNYDDKVAALDKYYYSASPYIAKVTFVPTSGYTGTCTISYTGYNTAGTSYSGTVKITVGSGSGDVSNIKIRNRRKRGTHF